MKLRELIDYLQQNVINDPASLGMQVGLCTELNNICPLQSACIAGVTTKGQQHLYFVLTSLPHEELLEEDKAEGAPQ